ncbi:MAG: phosphoesterase PA-phosphatase related protein [Actinomycetia bacterium]|nr:phosphoesterase PA-phosphatase related protein [Actinomycetes bacterium]
MRAERRGRPRADSPVQAGWRAGGAFDVRHHGGFMVIAPDRPVAVRRDTTVMRQLVALGFGSAALLVAGYLVGVRTTQGQKLDNAAWLGRHIATHQATHGARVMLATISVSSLAVAIGVLALLAFGRGRPRLAIVVGIATFGANLTSEVLKHFVLTRPVLLAHAPIVKNTYPSGHSTVAMSVAVAAVLVVPHRWRGTVGIVGFTYAAAIGVATVVVGWHRPSDVLGGYAVAIGWGAAAALSLALWRGARRAPDVVAARATPRIASLLAATGVGLIIAAFAVLIGVVGKSDQLFVLNKTRAFVAAAVAISATVALLGAALLTVLRGVTLDPPALVDD